MSDKPIAQRLQVKPGRRLALVDAPDGMDDLIGIPDQRAAEAEAEIVLLFVPDRAALEARLPPLSARIKADAILWLAYPKLSSALARDLNRDFIHAAAPGFGLDTVAAIAIDADWTALRFNPSYSPHIRDSLADMAQLSGIA